MRTDPPSPFRRITPEVLESREGGGCVAVFGVPFLLAGLFVFLMAVQVIPAENAAEVPHWAWPLMALVGLVFIAAGGALAFGRRWIRIDSHLRKVVTQRGLLVPMRSSERWLQSFDAVALRRHSESEGADTFRVALRASGGGGADQELFSSTDFAKSHAVAAHLAKFVTLPLVDASTRAESVLSPDRADAPLRDRLEESGSSVDVPPAPIRMRSRIEGSRIVIPGPRYNPVRLLGALVPIVVLAVAVPSLLQFFDRTDTPSPVQQGFVAFLALGFGVLPTLGMLRAAIASRRARTVVDVSRDGLTLEERAGFRSKTTPIAAADILDVESSTVNAAREAALRDVDQKLSTAGAELSRASRERTIRWAVRIAGWSKSQGITIKTRSGLFTIGAGLPDDEIEHLGALIRRGLAGGDVAGW